MFTLYKWEWWRGNSEYRDSKEDLPTWLNELLLKVCEKLYGFFKGGKDGLEENIKKGENGMWSINIPSSSLSFFACFQSFGGATLSVTKYRRRWSWIRWRFRLDKETSEVICFTGKVENDREEKRINWFCDDSVRLQAVARDFEEGEKVIKQLCEEVLMLR